MTPVEDNLTTAQNNLFALPSPPSAIGMSPPHLVYGEENMHLQGALLQSMRDQQMGELIRFHTR